MARTRLDGVPIFGELFFRFAHSLTKSGDAMFKIFVHDRILSEGIVDIDFFTPIFEASSARYAFLRVLRIYGRGEKNTLRVSSQGMNQSLMWMIRSLRD